MVVAFLTNGIRLFNNLTSKKYKNALYFLALLAIITFSFFFHSTSSFFWSFQYHPLLFELATFLTIFLITLTQLQKKLVVSFSKLDIAVAIYIIYCLIKTSSVSGILVHDNEVSLLVCYVLTYFFVRTSPIKPEYIYASFIFLGIVNTFIAAIQVFSSLSNNFQNTISFTGAFDNSAPLAGFLAGLVPLAIFLSKKYGNTKKLFTGITVLFIATIVASNSRAALFAVFILFGLQYLFLKILNKRKFNIARILTAVGFFIVAGVGSLILYFLRPASIKGRLLIWKVGFQMARNALFSGNGGGYVRSHYNLNQAMYFHTYGGTDAEKYLSGEVYFVFNEFLRVLIEYGFVGLILFLSILILVIKPLFKKLNNPLYLYSSYTIIIITVFGMCSYPFSTIPITLLFFCTTAIISKTDKKIIVSNLKIWLIAKFVVLILLVFLLKQTFDTYQSVKKWENGQSLWNYDDAGAIKEYESIKKNLSKNPAFLYNYGSQLVNLKYYKEGASILKESLLYFNSIDSYTQLGNCELKLNKNAEAEHFLTIAKYICPNRMIPKLNIFKFYITTLQKDKADQSAREIIETPIKIPTTTADSIKLIAKTYISNRLIKK